MNISNENLNLNNTHKYVIINDSAIIDLYRVKYVEKDKCTITIYFCDGSDTVTLTCVNQHKCNEDFKKIANTLGVVEKI